MATKLEAGVLFEILSPPPTQPQEYSNVILSAAASGGGTIVLTMEVTIGKAQIIPKGGDYFDEKYLNTCAYLPFKENTNVIDNSPTIMFYQSSGSLEGYFKPEFIIQGAKIGGAGPQ